MARKKRKQQGTPDVTETSSRLDQLIAFPTPDEKAYDLSVFLNDVKHGRLILPLKENMELASNESVQITYHKTGDTNTVYLTTDNPNEGISITEVFQAGTHQVTAKIDLLRDGEIVETEEQDYNLTVIDESTDENIKNTFHDTFAHGFSHEVTQDNFNDDIQEGISAGSLDLSQYHFTVEYVSAQGEIFKTEEITNQEPYVRIDALSGKRRDAMKWLDGVMVILSVQDSENHVVGLFKGSYTITDPEDIAYATPRDDDDEFNTNVHAIIRPVVNITSDNKLTFKAGFATPDSTMHNLTLLTGQTEIGVLAKEGNFWAIQLDNNDIKSIKANHGLLTIQLREIDTEAYIYNPYEINIDPDQLEVVEKEETPTPSVDSADDTASETDTSNDAEENKETEEVTSTPEESVSTSPDTITEDNQANTEESSEIPANPTVEDTADNNTEGKSDEVTDEDATEQPTVETNESTDKTEDKAEESTTDDKVTEQPSPQPSTENHVEDAQPVTTTEETPVETVETTESVTPASPAVTSEEVTKPEESQELPTSTNTTEEAVEGNSADTTPNKDEVSTETTNDASNTESSVGTPASTPDAESPQLTETSTPEVASATPETSDDDTDKVTEVETTEDTTGKPDDTETISAPTTETETPPTNTQKDETVEEKETQPTEGNVANNATETETQDTPQADATPPAAPVATSESEQPQAGTTEEGTDTTTNNTVENTVTETTSESPKAETTEESPTTPTTTVDETTTSEETTDNTTQDNPNQELISRIDTAFRNVSTTEETNIVIVAGNTVELGIDRNVFRREGVTETYRWTKDGTELSGTYRNRNLTRVHEDDTGVYTLEITFHKDGQVISTKSITYTLTVSQPEPKEEEVPTEASGVPTDEDNSTEKEEDLGVDTNEDETPPTPITIITNLGVVREGDTISIQAENIPEDSTIQWMVKVDGVIKEIDGQTTSHLYLKMTPEYDGNIYVRATKDGVVRESNMTEMDFQPNPPRLAEEADKNITVEQGSDVTFTLQATKDDYTEITWFHTSVNGSTQQIAQFAGKVEATLSNVQLSDAGSYYAEVVRLGSMVRSHDFILSVTEKEEEHHFIITFDKEAHVRAPAGQTFSIVANVENATTNTQYQWYRIENGTYIAIEGQTSTILAFPMLSVADNGFYTLEAFQGKSSVYANTTVRLEVVEQVQTDNIDEIIPSPDLADATDEQLLAVRQYDDAVKLFAISMNTYVKTMFDGNVVKPEEGQRLQAILYRDIKRIINLEDVKTYMSAMDMLVDYFWTYRETVFRDSLRSRFLSGISVDLMDKYDLRLFGGLTSLLVYMADPENNIPQSVRNVRDACYTDLAYARLVDYVERKTKTRKHASLRDSAYLADEYRHAHHLD